MSLVNLAKHTACVLIFCSLSPYSTLYATEDTILLTITGDLIDVIEKTDPNVAPNELIDRYYGELEPDEFAEVSAMRRSLVELIPDYNVAFAAADTAEINSVLSDFAYRWAVLRTFHAEHYTLAASEELERAYGEAYRLLR